MMGDEDMDELTKLQNLTRFVFASGKKVSAKKLQKLAFLCQFADTELGQDFEFQHYEVFSSTLVRDLQAAQEAGLIEICGNGEAATFSVALVDNLSSQLTESTEQGLKTIVAIRDESIESLDVLSTVCYLRKVGYSDAEIDSKLQELKGEFKDCFAKAISLANQHFAQKARDLVTA